MGPRSGEFTESILNLDNSTGLPLKSANFWRSDMKTYLAQKSGVQRRWVMIDLENRVLGRAATEIADLLRGKGRVDYTPHVDTGDFVVAVNASKIRLTGKKWTKKMYHRHSGYMGGLKSLTAEKLLQKRPEDLIRFAVKGMLPKNKLGEHIFKKLKVYAGNTHPHQAQQPQGI